MYVASIPVIVLNSIGCLRFPICPRAGGGGPLICCKKPRAAARMGTNPDVVESLRVASAVTEVDDYGQVFTTKPKKQIGSKTTHAHSSLREN